MRVLVVEDDAYLRPMVAELLDWEGHEAVTAGNGREALLALERMDGQGGHSHAPPDVILLDMRMPVMDGWQFARAYRERPGPKAPVVVMTAASDAEKWAREVGADDYLAKPFDLAALLETVNRFGARPERSA
jgi:two-component system, chemotaxis family, chemotaxis protein CheY